jgi:hypothetical protein
MGGGVQRPVTRLISYRLFEVLLCFD